MIKRHGKGIGMKQKIPRKRHAQTQTPQRERNWPEVRENPHKELGLTLIVLAIVVLVVTEVTLVIVVIVVIVGVVVIVLIVVLI